jgi:hypothetical protein
VKRTEVDESGAEVERTVVVGFRGVPVFRLEDTEGAKVEYPDYAPAELPPLHDVAERLSVPVRYPPNGGGARGAYNVVRGDITLATHDVDTFFHELGHAAHATLEPLKGGQNPRQEIVAETVAAVLCRLYGYDGYLAEARDYVAFYAGHDEPGKAVVRLVADVAKVLDVILGEGASAPSPATGEPVPAVKAPAPRSKRDAAKEAIAATKGCPKLVSLAYRAGSSGYLPTDERLRAASSRTSATSRPTPTRSPAGSSSSATTGAARTRQWSSPRRRWRSVARPTDSQSGRPRRKPGLSPTAEGETMPCHARSPTYESRPRSRRRRGSASPSSATL